jgi:hypothetical protein
MARTVGGGGGGVGGTEALERKCHEAWKTEKLRGWRGTQFFCNRHVSKYGVYAEAGVCPVQSSPVHLARPVNGYRQPIAFSRREV